MSNSGLVDSGMSEGGGASGEEVSAREGEGGGQIAISYVGTLATGLAVYCWLRLTIPCVRRGWMGMDGYIIVSPSPSTPQQCSIPYAI